MISLLSAITAAAIWMPFGFIGGLVIVMFGWLKLDIRDLGHRLEKLEGSHSQTMKDVARMEGTMLALQGVAKWQGREP